MSTFAELPLDRRLLNAVESLGYDTPTPIQVQAIPLLVEGRDVVGGARTGSGKTAAFGLPLLHKLRDGGGVPRALVLCPTRELAVQVTKSLEGYAKELPIRMVTLYGGAHYRPQLDALRQGVDVVVATPGRLIDHLDRGTLKLDSLQVVVLDEADEMLRMGFIDDVEKILEATPENRQVALFSATMPPPIRRIAERYLRNPVSVEVETRALSVDHIDQRGMIVPQGNKIDALVRLLQVMPGETHLIFTRTRLQAAETAGELSRRGIASDAMHGDLQQAARERVLSRFRAGRLQVVVATDVAARGIDVEPYVHRIGRTGRAGRQGKATTLVTRRERFRLNKLEQALKVVIKPLRVPTDADIARRQIKALQAQLIAVEEVDPARVVVLELMDETELTALEIAARALALLAQATDLRLDSGADEAPAHVADAHNGAEPAAAA